jgi:uncharacterized membrane protein YhaH (DUF805 family)
MDFDGVASRKEFILFQIFFWAIIILLGYAYTTFALSILGYLLFGYFVISLPALLAINVRRLHDINASGWWVLMMFIPILGFIYFFIVLFSGSEHKNNPYLS